jgi:hypothetical protein
MGSERLVCPYNECRREIGKPIMLTDFSKTPRETYYACPHCLTKVDVVVKDQSLDSVSLATSKGASEKTPSECPYRFGYLNTLSRDAAIPDGCLICPKLLQCFVKKENLAKEV